MPDHPHHMKDQQPSDLIYIPAPPFQSHYNSMALSTPPAVTCFCSSQLYTIHDITCGPAFKAAALDLLTAAEAEVEEGFGQQTEPVIMALETMR